MIKEIKLKPTIVFHNYAKVAVIDFPDGKERERCQISVDFAESDVAKQKTQGKDFDACLKHYEKWLYEVVKVNIAMDWKCISGYEEVMDIIREHVSTYY